MNLENKTSRPKKISNKQDQLFSFVLPVNGQTTNGIITNLYLKLKTLGDKVNQEYLLFNANSKSKLVLLSTFYCCLQLLF